MKKKLIITMLALFGLLQAVAQEYEYVPFVREGVKWVYSYSKSTGSASHMTQCISKLEMKGDVIIDGKMYKAMHKYSGEEINWENDTIPVYLREEDRVVYGIVPDGKTYADCPVGFEPDADMMAKIAGGEEFVLYDFNDPVTFIEGFIQCPSYQLCKVITDDVYVSEKKMRRFIFSNYNYDYCIIEGIGLDGKYGYPLAIQNNFYENSLHLIHVEEKGSVIYTSESSRYEIDYDDLMNRPAIAREGVQWVNERVIINKGDTTRSYYCYEFCGMDDREFALCYSYEGDTLDIEHATVVAKAQNYGYSPGVGSNVPFWANLPLMKVIEEGRDMIMSTNHEIYSFCVPGFSDIARNYTANYYIFNQKEMFLTRQNLVELEPQEIDGMSCQRFAYIDEQGEPLAYLVEGIGFDSRDMGDLLTPFTRKPDPDAEYQEWCGLSHVIKDGKIIYKGMCYDAAHVEGGDGVLDGDVNGDGMINIADVTALINLLLHENGQSFNAGADLDSNGNVNLKDLVELIDFILVR